jgi:hypothetical protein
MATLYMLCMHVCVYMYACMNVCMCSNANDDMTISKGNGKIVHGMYACVCVSSCILMHIHTYTYIHALYVCMYVCCCGSPCSQSYILDTHTHKQQQRVSQVHAKHELIHTDYLHAYICPSTYILIRARTHTHAGRGKQQQLVSQADAKRELINVDPFINKLGSVGNFIDVFR